ncbi:MAG: molecular chaperone TorD family protein [bacterium]|nr:molecular chaperone TorD family protein [bacterium]
MTDSTTFASPDATTLAAREFVLRFLALATSDPAARRFEQLLDPALQELSCAAARHLATAPEACPETLAPGEVAVQQLDLAPLVAALADDAGRAQAADDHTRVFGLVVSKECPPYEVQYCPQTFSVYRSQHMADVAGFYAAFGVAPGRDAPERADHIACELEFQAWLVAKQRYAVGQEGDDWAERANVCREAQRDFLSEHLAWWVPAFARALECKARALAPPAPFHAAVASALASLVPIERALLDVAPPTDLALPRTDADEAQRDCASCAQDA